MKLKFNLLGSPGISSVGVISQCHIPNWTNIDSPHSVGRRSRSSRRTLVKLIDFFITL